MGEADEAETSARDRAIEKRYSYNCSRTNHSEKKGSISLG